MGAAASLTGSLPNLSLRNEDSVRLIYKVESIVS